MGGVVFRPGLVNRKTVPVYSNDDDNSIDVRLTDLQTGELTFGYVDALVSLFPPEPQRTDEHFSEEGGRLACGNGLVQSAIVAREGKFRVSVYADVLEIKREGRGALVKDKRRRAGWTRGKVKGFKRRPRHRMMLKLGKIRGVQGAYFVTLTFPDEVMAGFASGDQAGMVDYAKKALRRFEKRLFRLFKDAGYVWRVELEDRKSGILPGVYIPHFHLLVFGMRGRLPLLQRWVSRAWYSAVGSGLEKHLKAGTQVREITSRRHMVNYVTKYIGKLSDDEFEAGNRYGMRGKVDMSASFEDVANETQAVALKRLVRGWLKGRGSSYAQRVARLPRSFGVTLLGLGDSSNEAFSLSRPTVLRMLDSVWEVDDG